MATKTVKQTNMLRIYGSYAAQVNLLTDEEAGRLLKAMLAYRNNGEVRNLNNMEMLVFQFIKPQLDYDIERCRKNRENGAKGGRPRKNPAPETTQDSRQYEVTVRRI